MRPVIHHDDPVAEGKGLLLVMGHVEKRHPEPALEILELDLHVAAHLEVERPQRLVQKKEPGLVDECTGQSHALLLSAGELVWEPLEHRAHVDLGQCVADPSCDLLGREPSELQAECDVVENREVRKQRVVLEDRIDGTPVRELPQQGAAIHLQRAFGDGFEAADHPEDRRLPAAGRTENGDETVARQIEIDAAHGLYGSEAFRQTTSRDQIGAAASIRGASDRRHPQLALTSFQMRTHSE